MNATERSYNEVANEYRTALGVWSEARAMYPAEAAEVEAATRHVEELERELAAFPHLTSEPAALVA